MATPKEEYFDAYKEHSKTLRTWLVAYGIGAPVLFLTNEKLVAKFMGSTDSELIAGFFLTGVVLQVFLAVMNKAVNWASYFAEGHEEKKKKDIYLCLFVLRSILGRYVNRHCQPRFFCGCDMEIVRALCKRA